MSQTLTAVWDSLRRSLCAEAASTARSGGRAGARATMPDPVDATRQPADSLLPSELWTVVLGLAGSTPQARFVCARVCRQWRCIVMADRRCQKQPQYVGAQVCRLRLARDAIDRDDQRLFEWAVVDATDSHLEDGVLCALWRRIAEHDALGCAAVLRIVGHWPFPCAVVGCHCATDPPTTAVINATGRGYKCTQVDCGRLALVMTAVRSRSVRVLSLFLAWDVSHPHRWVDDAVRHSLGCGHEDVLELLWANGIAPHIPRSALSPSDDPWLNVAAISDKPASLAWIFDHIESDGYARGRALILSAQHGTNNTLGWLCQRQHFYGFGVALAAAALAGRVRTIAVMETYAPGARFYAEAHATTLGDLIRESKCYSKLDARGKALLADFL
ncbi:hypothetical protein psal_cds_977 [Pandoravirus salinus]|uniref:F-box incomplete domain containing protein n=1 Tax=Pandoravirus salinus TaxID=1349410 RepID=S4VXP6_9VIRU|nr:hypothetical protein psal_cds_977 [Pandoravirus salinus]AGO85138.1 hypothetical protein psal_cds_977 [Pandoravirus salinus]